MRRFLPTLTIVGVLAAAPAGHAGGSLLVDDTGVTAAGHCQLESWLRGFAGGGAEGTTVPACATGPVEWSMAITRLTRAPDQLGPSVKWQLLDNTRGGFGLAAATSITLVHGRFDERDAYLAPGWSLGTRQQWQLAVNLGSTRLRGGAAFALGGAGLQYAMNDTLSLIAEKFWRERHGHASQAGMRWSLDANDSIDLLAGAATYPARARWATLGLNVAF
jgi:hypothetical protein